MITIKLQGGLGNQLFQYATGRALSIVTGQPLVLDLYYLHSTHYSIKNETPRSYELYPYDPDVRIAAPKKGLLQLLPSQLIKYRYGTLHYKSFKQRITEQNFADAASSGGNILLDGYFQDERFFINIREQLIKEIRLTVPRQYKHVVDDISHTNSVAVHVRRGDYVSNANASDFHGILPVSYYENAFELVSKRSGSCTFFFFSDDIDWVRKNFSDIPDARFVDIHSSSIHAELELMRLCKHQVIANSSFSWWGAWLNNHPGKLVVAPKRWFSNEEKNASFTLPVDWMRI